MVRFMSRRLMLESREPDHAAPRAPAVGDTADRDGSVPAAVLPSPLTAVASAVTGGAIGVAMVYGVAARLADTLAGVAVIVLVFAMTMAGPRVHAVSRTEAGRAVAVALEAIAFGGALGALIVLT